MKKIFSTVAMAMVAFVSVVTMSSCNNGDTSSFNAAPVIPSSTTTTASTGTPLLQANTYSVGAVLSEDVLALYDVKVDVKADGQTKTYTNADFTNSKEITVSDGKDEVKYPTKGISTYTFKAEKASVKTTFTLKANYEEILASMNKDELKMFAMPQFKTPNSLSNNGNGILIKVSKCTAEYLNMKGDFYANMLSL